MATKQRPDRARDDVIVSESSGLAAALANHRRRNASLTSAARLANAMDPKRNANAVDRMSLVEDSDQDPKGFERVIGESDLTSINYLDRGRRAAASVCRIRVPTEGGEWYGTGFLVGPRLLLTNHHVLGNVAEAARSRAEFGYEHDLEGVLQPVDDFNVTPSDVFFTDPELDVTLVSISPLSGRSAPAERYGWLPLLPLSGKSVDGEWVTIIQHPNGGPKQISIRSNRIVRLLPKEVPDVNLEHFIHYLTDTEPGSSGAPVVNDQWQVVAVHHKAVAAPLKKGAKPDADPEWLGNEGVRISAIFAMLEERRLDDPMAERVLDRLDKSFGFPSMSSNVAASDTFEADRKPFPLTRWRKKDLGYDPGFLSKTIDLAPIYAKQRNAGLTAPLLKSPKDDELKYQNFSVIIHVKRKFALMTAVNIKGDELKHPGARSDTWRRDDRMAEEYQPAGNFYETTKEERENPSKARDKIAFSRGHLVRRFDPCWGTAAETKAGEEDTFHYTNAAPQFQAYNDIDWGNLEDYLLDKAQTSEKRMTVFTGPIFRQRDPLYGKKREGGPWRIPLSFWKIAVLQKTATEIRAAAFIVGQTNYVQALYEAKVFSGLKPYSVDELRSRKIQVTVAAVEHETGLDFGMLRSFDAQGGLESTRQARWIDRIEDVQI